MKNLIIIVEGQTEKEFVNRLLAPYLITTKNINTSIIAVIVSMSGGGHGFNNIDHFKNTIKPVLYYKDEPIITTMLDHYGINSERKLPQYNEIVKEPDIEKRLKKMECKLSDIVKEIKSYNYFIPYIQRHEMETLLLANPEKGFEREDDKIKEDVIKLCTSFKSIEDINCTPQGCPSHRLQNIYSDNGKKYVKGSDAVDIAELTTIEVMLEKCPRFKNWVEKISQAILES